MEEKKYPMEQFKIKIVKPTPDHECVTRFAQYYHNEHRYFFKSHFAVSLLSQHNRVLVIHTFIFNEGSWCVNKTVERKALKQCTFSSDDPDTIY